MEQKKDYTIFYVVVFLGLLFLLAIFTDRRANGQTGEEIIIEEPKASSTNAVPFISDEQKFFELPDFVKYEITLEQKKVTDDLASKYAQLYDTCRFRTGFIPNQ